MNSIKKFSRLKENNFTIEREIIAGFITYTIIKVVRRKFNELHPTMSLIFILSILTLIYM